MLQDYKSHVQKKSITIKLKIHNSLFSVHIFKHINWAFDSIIVVRVLTRLTVSASPVFLFSRSRYKHAIPKRSNLCSCDKNSKSIHKWTSSFPLAAKACFSARPRAGVLPIEAASLFGWKMNPQGTWPGSLLCMQCVARFKLAINYPIKTDRNAHQEFQPISPSFWLEHD